MISKIRKYALLSCMCLLFTWVNAAYNFRPEGNLLPVDHPENIAGIHPDVNASIQWTAHPRLFFPGGQETEIVQKAKKNPLLSQLIGTLKKEAEKKLAIPLQAFTADGKMLHVAREQISRILTLSMAYRFFKEDKYAAKVEEELLHMCGFVNWSPSHFLDVAEMTTAAAIGYDWCYSFLKPETRASVEKAIVEKAFAPAWPLYEKEGKTPFSRENNWNMVCNAGMVNGALAIGDKYPVEADRIVSYAVKYAPNLLKAFTPEGVFNEGPMYWSYNGMFMALLFDNLNRIVKKNFGLSGFEGLKNTARYYIEQTGPLNVTFNYGDASDQVDYSPTFFFFSRHYLLPDVAVFYRNQIKSALDEYQVRGEFDFPRLFFLAIPWFDDSEVTKKLPEKKLTVFNGITDLLIFNGNDKSDNNRLFLAAKTGRGDWSHNQLDGGSFVLDCDGERWGADIGADSYSLPDFWDYKPGGVRWNYFRNTNMAHSTLSIDDKITDSSGQGEIISVNQDHARPWGVFDLSPYYRSHASSVKRGFRLLSPKVMLVQDEIELPAEARKVSWRFLTLADVTIDGNIALLTQNGKKFFIKCLLPAGFEMRVFPAKPYTGKEKPIMGVNIVEITLNPVGKSSSIPVMLGNRLDEPEIKNFVPNAIKDWK